LAQIKEPHLRLLVKHYLLIEMFGVDYFNSCTLKSQEKRIVPSK